MHDKYNWYTEHFIVTTNAKNTCQHFQRGASPPHLLMPVGAHAVYDLQITTIFSEIREKQSIKDRSAYPNRKRNFD